MTNKVAASMTASIVIDKSDILTQALKGIAQAQKELNDNKLELLFDVSDDKVRGRLKDIQKELSSKDYIIKFKNQGIEETLKSLDELFEKIKLIISGKAFGNGNGNGIGNFIVDEESLKSVIDLFKTMESHLFEMKKIFVDVGDGEEFSPLLKMINELQKSVSNLSKSFEVGFNLNIDVGSSTETDNKIQSKISNALQAYQRLFEHIKVRGIDDDMLYQKFVDFDINQFDTTMGKLQAYRKFIENIKKDANARIPGYGDKIFAGIDKKYFSEASAAMAQVTRAFNEAKKANETPQLSELFGKTDLTEVIVQLGLIVDKLGEISSTASKFNDIFKDGINVSTSIEEIEKLTNRVKELEEELIKLKNPTSTEVNETNISSPMKDTFQGDKIEQAATSAKNLDKILDNVDIPEDSFDDVIAKFNIAEEKAQNIVKITKQMRRDVKGNPIESYNITYKNGSNEIYGESSKPQLLRSNDVLYNAKDAEKLQKDFNQAYEEAVKINNALNETKLKIDGLSKHPELSAQFLEVKNTISNLNAKLTQGEISVSEYNKAVKETVSNYTKMINIQQNRDVEMYNAKAKEEENKKLSEQKEKYEELSRTIDRYITVRKRIASGKALSSDEQEAKDLKKTIDELNKTDILSDEQYKTAKNRLEGLETSVKDIIALTKSSSIDSMQSKIDTYNKRYVSVNNKPSDKNRSTEYQEAINKYKNSIKELEVFLKNFKKSSDPVTEKSISEWNELIEKVDEASNALKIFSAAEKGSSEHSRGKEIDKLTKYLDANTKISKEARKELEKYLALLKSGDPSVNVQEIHTAWTKVAVAEREAGREGKAFFDIFKDKALYGYAAQLANYYLSLMDFIRYGKAVVNNVIEIDNALTELRKVSDASENRLTQNFKTSAEAAKDLGASVYDLISATADWSRMGYSVDDAEELARITTLYKNVGDGIDIETANASLISTLQGFQLTADDAEGVIDRFNEVSNNFAIDSAGIGEALQRSAASFNAANTDLSKSIALITATNEVVQDPDSVGTLWKTMSARIRGASTELSELGEETDRYTESTSELRDLVMGLTGFDIMLDENTFKDIYEIILGIGKEWKNLTDIEQASLGEALAGKRNANALYAVLGNLDTLQDAYKTAEESAGSAMREQENYEKSIQYSIDRLNASVEEWSNNLVSSDIVKFFVDLLNLIVEISNAITPLGTLAIGGGIFAGVKNVGRDKMLSLIYVLNLPTIVSVL